MKSENRITFLKSLEIHDLDTLDLGSLAHSLHQGIYLANMPFRLAVFGPWGSGKTTILRRVQKMLERTSAKPHNGNGRSDEDDIELESPILEGQPTYTRTLWFNPWEYEAEDNLMYSLVTILTSMIPDGVRYSRKGTRVVRTLVESVQRLARRTHPGTVRPHTSSNHDDEPDRLMTLREAFRRFVDLILSPGGRGQPRRLVVFVDDLDKCNAHAMLNFLEVTKLFIANDTRIIFVFSLDRQVLTNAINLKYNQIGGFDASRYTDKIFEFTYEVHPVQWHQLGSLVSDLYHRSNLGAELEDGVRTHEIGAIEGVLQKPGVILNPRKLKRIFNKFIWFLAARDWIPAARELPLEGWLSWILIAEYWKEYRDFVSRYGEEVLGEMSNRVTGNLLFPHANETVRHGLEQIPHYRGLFDYFRSLFNDLGDMHTPETQDRLRELVKEYVVIDRTLRAHGV